jgi:DNA-binding response OmpR family regulator
MHVLMIEDDLMNAAVYRRVLEDAGYCVSVQSDGMHGLRTALADPHDAIFIDLDLPDVDGLHVGLALARHMRQGRMRAIPLIALTARSDTATRREAGRLGFDAFISKPCDGADLLHVLDALAPGFGEGKA